ncbi:MAG TPA: ABC transporter permease [Gammaproteobacteria bacterium]|jgi:tungstate transport system permease protein|nr:ABC transporter permease [Gammaproteobacteria bacterium]
MQDFGDAFALAGQLLVSFDPDLREIVGLSLRVSVTSVLIACLLGFPLGALIAVGRFPGRGLLHVFVSAMMGLPPVVVGLMVYLMLSNAGPLGSLQWLYSPAAMMIAQTVLITPIIAALTAQVVADLNREYHALFQSLCVPAHRRVAALLWDARFSLLTVALAGFGRAVAEVGAVMIVGGNIANLTRVMTTAIALETAKGELGLALALGMVLMLIAFAINAVLMVTRARAVERAYV